MKKIIILTLIVLLAFCSIGWTENESKIIKEEINLIIEFPLSKDDLNRNETAKSICEETAQSISEQREETYVGDLSAVIIDINEDSKIGKLKCSFELERGPSCDCPAKDCGNFWINGCSSGVCQDYERAICKCGDCNDGSLSNSSCYCM